MTYFVILKKWRFYIIFPLKEKTIKITSQKYELKCSALARNRILAEVLKTRSSRDIETVVIQARNSGPLKKLKRVTEKKVLLKVSNFFIDT